MPTTTTDLYTPTGNDDIDSMFAWLDKVEAFINFVAAHQYAIAGIMGMSLMAFIYVTVGRRDVKTAQNKYRYNQRNYR